MQNVVTFACREIEPNPQRWAWMGNALVVEIGEKARHALFFLPRVEDKLDRKTLGDISAKFNNNPQFELTADCQTAYLALDLQEVSRQELHRVQLLLQELVPEPILEFYAPPTVFGVLSGEILEHLHGPAPLETPPETNFAV